MGVGGTAILAAINPTVAALGLANIGLYGQAARNFIEFFSKISSQFFEPEKSFTYTRMKRKHWLNTQVGAIVGAIPPLMGYTAASGGSFGIEGTCVAAMLFFWQFPHYYALAANKNQDRVISNVFCAIKLLFQVLFDPPKPATISRFPMKLDQK